MVDAALSIAADQIIEYSTNGSLLERAATGARPPRRRTSTRGRDDDGSPSRWPTTSSGALATRSAAGVGHGPVAATAGRRDQHDALDEHLAAWCGERKADEIVEQLWAAGVPVGKVMQPHEQGELEQLQYRGFFEDVEHPVTGTARHSTLPIRFSRGPERFHTRHAPLLGEHNDEVLRGLGLSDDEIAALDADGVIGRAPTR